MRIRLLRPIALALASLLILAVGALRAEGVSLPVLKTTLPASWDESGFGSPAVSDLDANGRMQRKVTLDKRGAMGAPTLADVDGDHRIDIVVSLKDAVGGGAGGVRIWTVASAGYSRPAWPTGRGNSLRTGQAWRAEGPTHALPPKGKGRLGGKPGSARAGGSGTDRGVDPLGVGVDKVGKAASGRPLFRVPN